MLERTHRRLIERLRAAEPLSAPFEIDADRYRSTEWAARERAVFAGPRVVAASAALAEPGACVTAGDALLVRGRDGVLRAFANACRHRGTRLVAEPCVKKGLVCPYHGWTYDLGGKLLHVPHREAFAGMIDLERRDLRELPMCERHGLVWLGTADAAGFLGELDEDLAAMGAADHVVWRSARTERRCNWKLIVEAFLDGYHIRTLHRDSIARFFLDAASVAEEVGPHVRAATARRDPPADAPLRELATPSYLIFPATVIIEHPDFVSIIVLEPRGPDTTDFQHTMLVPAARAAEEHHWSRSWALIEETVFQREDLWVSEQIQRGLGAGVERLLFGAHEHSVRWFHASLEARMDHGAPGR